MRNQIWVFVFVPCLVRFFMSLSLGFSVLGMHVRSIYRVSVGDKVCGYTYNQVWGLWISVKLTAYDENIETN